MQASILFYLIISLIASFLVAFFQYFYKEKSKRKINILLCTLKTISLFLLCLLLINPTIKNSKTESVKPVLSVLIDNSASVKYLKKEQETKRIVERLKKNKSLNNKFTINYFSFGRNLQTLDSLSFNEKQTNISKAINSINKLYKNDLGAVLLLSDGNQTFGDNYEFINSKKSIYPLVIGDTTKFKDISITQVNVNKYSYIKNQFPVETLLFYDGKENITVPFSIFNEKNIVYTKKLHFTPTDNVKTVTTNLSSVKEGVNYYTVSVGKLKDEKNINNNRKDFSVEVINEQTKVLLLTSFLHPDIGALKRAIESNKQRSVTIKLAGDLNIPFKDYQLIIVYQPDNKFKYIFNQLKKNNFNYFIVSGTQTDWSFLNKQQLGFTKKVIPQTENYGAVYNAKFPVFFQKDIGFNAFPPLKDYYGELLISKQYQTIAYQNIEGIESNQPLLVTLEQQNQKSAALFGEGIWKWRATSFLKQNDFKDFDEFTGNLIQYLAVNKLRKRLEVSVKNLYPANSTISINAFYTDKNYKFDPRANLWIEFTNIQTKVSKKLPFSLALNSYQIDIEGLQAGNYLYSITVDNQSIKEKGRFKITTYQVEMQFTNANQDKLQQLSDRTGGKLFYSNQETKLLKELITDNTYYTSQKIVLKEQNLIDWKSILLLIILLLTLEWSLRKYYGKL